MEKDFIVSKVESPQDGSHYVLVAFTDPNTKSTGGGDSPTFKITMKEYKDTAIRVGDKVMIEIKKANNNGV
jgi:hypothetical protein